MTLIEKVDEAIMSNISRSDDRYASAKAAIAVVIEEVALMVENKAGLIGIQLAKMIREMGKQT